ncbi:hypothetical protein TRIUR3_00727 [Triticum urartu]|uniref:Uncharacterized protein n=1 Tax=Triticum urartu TaxID=4572 RepID=M7ZPY2_TRIUA|nr:hypothetical protein TRIUR3_00727 [Triticum urartu]
MSAKRKPGRSPAAAANATAQAKEDDAGGLFSSRSSAYLGLQGCCGGVQIVKVAPHLI